MKDAGHLFQAVPLAKDKKFSPAQLYESLLKVKDAIDRPLFGTEAEAQQDVQILPDKSIGLGKFLPHPLLPEAFKAHPQTIAAVRKDIFMGGEGFEDLEEMVECKQCSKSLDKQFWVFCPFCGAEFSK